jgi:ABC-type spermidine/putrescine transport system permease subunit I
MSAQDDSAPRGGLSERLLYGLLLVPPVVVMGGLFAYPLLDLLAQSFGSPQGWLGHYLALLDDEVFLIALRNTFTFALLTAAGTAVLGYPVALLIASVRPLVASVLLLLVMVPFWTSVLVRSYAWIVLLGRGGVINGVLLSSGLIAAPLPMIFNQLGVTIGMIHVMLPYMVLPILGAMSRLDRNLLAAADSLGASRRQTFFRVLLPLTLPGVIGGAVLVFVLSLGFFVTPALMGGPRDLVAAMVIHDEITRRLAWDEAAASAAVLLLLTAGTFVVCARIFGLRRHMSFELR